MRQKLAENERLYEDKQGNIKSRRVAKTIGAKTGKKGKDIFYEPEVQSNRPEDRYGVRTRTRAKSARASRSRETAGLVV